MHGNPKRTEALRLLDAAGIWRLNYAPPYVRILWALGIDAPPPHFATFSYNALVSGTFFAVGISVAKWLIEGWPLRRPPSLGWLELAVMSVLFGLWMARYYAAGRRRYGLPTWRELQAGG